MLKDAAEMQTFNSQTVLIKVTTLQAPRNSRTFPRLCSTPTKVANTSYL